jgi:hypothetical protein
MSMTPLYPATNGTAPNTWRQNLVIYPLSVLLLAICAVLVVMLFVEAEMGRK